jgi:hypothetical protein
MGRGCRIGRPCSLLAVVTGLRGGNGICPDCALVGRVPPGEDRGRGGGTMGNIWDARREVGRDVGCEVCGAKEPLGCEACGVVMSVLGEAGPEFSSGTAILASLCSSTYGLESRSGERCWSRSWSSCIWCI